MTDYRVTYKRPKPAGSIQFDPNQEFIDIIDIPSPTPEEATHYISRNMPYLDIIRLEKLPDQPVSSYGEALYDVSHYYVPSIVASGAQSQWPDRPDVSSNLSTIARSISEIVANYSGAIAIISTLRKIGVEDEILSPLEQNIDGMKAEANRLNDELGKALSKENQVRLQQLAGESDENRERQILVSNLVEELVSCNLLSRKKLATEIFNCSPDIVNVVHTPCRSGDDFKIKIGALANLFEIELRPLKALVKELQDDWKSIKLIEALANQNSWAYDPKMFEAWRAIVDLRNATFPYHVTDTRIVELVSQFGQSFPPNYTDLWKAILNRLFMSIREFRQLLAQVH